MENVLDLFMEAEIDPGKALHVLRPDGRSIPDGIPSGPVDDALLDMLALAVRMVRP